MISFFNHSFIKLYLHILAIFDLYKMITMTSGLVVLVVYRIYSYINLVRSLKFSDFIELFHVSLLTNYATQSAAPRYLEDLENLLHERMILSFNTDIEDGSIEEVIFNFY